MTQPTEIKAGLPKKPKHIMIADMLRADIVQGRIAQGLQLPPDSKLAETYKVNNRTIANGMSILVSEGLVTRSPRRGTVVINSVPQQRVSNAVGVFTYDTGEVARELSHALLHRGLYPVWVNQLLYGDVVMSPSNSDSLKCLMSKMLDDNPYGFIMEGDRFMPFDFLQRNLPRLKRLAIVRFNLAKHKIPGAKYSLIDSLGIGRQIAKYLIDHGHRKLTFFAHYDPLNGPEYPLTTQRLMIQGMAEYCRLANVEFVHEIPQALMRGEGFGRIVNQFFTDPQHRPTGCMLSQDSLWDSGLCHAFAQHSLLCPRDVSIVGCYNSEYAIRSRPALTSVQTNDALIAKRCVELLTGERDEDEFLAPFSIIERDSVRTV